ncbi:sulfite exporter TauE/SafE family protein [Asticcacaulis tiandongensis]|uniref:sulfite exporter TauE/SafE family protein n=1 Tax=Asticcacaulis tiandongensis TaxID=2565365 RepID=UPI0011266E02|nr:sulfite exporter TauE/SafE family protein [Asticcacaulis tiandongensis]
MLDIQHLLAAFAGAVVGFTLSLVGGGGSILAVPLLVYFVGITNPHLAIGTSAVSVALNAALSLIGRARSGTVKWRCVAVFTITGVIGALIGSFFGRALNGKVLLCLFALLMVVVAGLMLKHRNAEGNPKVRLNRDNFPRLVAFGLATGLLSGFFGIGGGFLIVPSLMAATAMPIVNAISSSLFAVTAFGISTASTYAFAGLVDWAIAIAFVCGGIAGSVVGARAAKILAAKRGHLTTGFAGLIFIVAAYMLYRSLIGSTGV